MTSIAIELDADEQTYCYHDEIEMLVSNRDPAARCNKRGRAPEAEDWDLQVRLS